MGVESSGGAGVSVEFARLVNDAGGGDRQAAAELLPLVYEQLRNLAQHHLSMERPDHTLQATALVHEAYLRLVGEGGGPGFQGRWHFFAAAAEAMRRILVDQARKRGSIKRGAGMRRLEFDQLGLSVCEPPDDLVSLDEGLTLLGDRHPEKAQLVNLRYFAGLTIEEAAEAIGVSVATANRYWAYAKAWLYRHLTGDAHGPAAASTEVARVPTP